MFQTLIQILILVLLLGAVPLLVGGIFARADGEGLKLPLRWVSGQMALWAGFQVICVPAVLKKADFRVVVVLFAVYMGVLCLFSLGAEIKSLAERRQGERKHGPGVRRSEWILWLIFCVLLLFQLVQAVRLTYGDGDDAYYVAVSTATEGSDRMYTKMAYTGFSTDKDLRHGLAPFPIWIAFLARVSGMPAVMTAHVAVAVTLIAMGYAALALIGTQLFGSRAQMPLFLIFAEILVLFGGYSIYTAENFMIARSRQGKAALSSLVIPFLFFLLLYLFRKMDEGKRVHARYYLLVLATVTAGCLCSTMGAMLCCTLTGTAGIVGFFLYRNIKSLFPLIFCCLPGIVYMLLYVLL
ncbi:MAG: hypothetical protein K2K63_11325 [Acetatifactor sp.]|nr:hypothetical protein [Acetatifactor sp.]